MCSLETKTSIGSWIHFAQKQISMTQPSVRDDQLMDLGVATCHIIVFSVDVFYNTLALPHRASVWFHSSSSLTTNCLRHLPHLFHIRAMFPASSSSTNVSTAHYSSAVHWFALPVKSAICRFTHLRCVTAASAAVSRQVASTPPCTCCR